MHAAEERETIESGALPACAALARIKRGNIEYLNGGKREHAISVECIFDLFEGGQHPYAVVISCSDSRVVPELVFTAGPGELFVIRVAGNVVGPSELASAAYACEHLHSKLILVLGHTHCGAIEATVSGEVRGPVASITSRIARAIGSERDPYLASVLNVRSSMEEVKACPEIARLPASEGLEVRGAIYRTHSGVVDFLD